MVKLGVGDCKSPTLSLPKCVWCWQAHGLPLQSWLVSPMSCGVSHCQLLHGDWLPQHWPWLVSHGMVRQGCGGLDGDVPAWVQPQFTTRSPPPWHWGVCQPGLSLWTMGCFAHICWTHCLPHPPPPIGGDHYRSWMQPPGHSTVIYWCGHMSWTWNPFHIHHMYWTPYYWGGAGGLVAMAGGPVTEWPMGYIPCLSERHSQEVCTHAMEVLPLQL